MTGFLLLSLVQVFGFFRDFYKDLDKYRQQPLPYNPDSIVERPQPYNPDSIVNRTLP